MPAPVDPKVCSSCERSYDPSLSVCPFCGASAGAGTALGPGSILDGKYEIVSFLGGGSMGNVFKARHLDLDAIRAIKVMKKALVANPEFRNRFLREARLATRVQHANVATLHDFSTLADGSCFIVTEFVDGRTVRQTLADQKRFPLPLAVEIAIQTLSGLAQIHRLGMIHRDLSADNVMITSDADGRTVAKIIDLGVAKALDSVDSTYAEVTQVAMFVGNARYASPEQFGDLREGERIDHRADLYCLGIVLYEMVTGVPPFVGRSHQEWMVKHLTQPPTPFAISCPGTEFPDGFESIVHRALEKERDERYSTAGELAEALAPYAGRPSANEESSAAHRALAAFERQKTVAISNQIDESTLHEETEAIDLTLFDRIRECAERGDVEELETLANSAGITGMMRDAALEAAEHARMQNAEQRRLKDARAAEEARLREEARAREEARLIQEARAREEARAADEARIREEIRAREEARAIEEARAREEARVREETRIREEARARDEARTREETRAREEARAAEESRLRKELRAREETRAREESRAWTDALARSNAEGWHRFIESWPESALRLEAEQHHAEAVDFEEAIRTDSAPGWQAFLDRWPNGSHAKAASESLDRSRRRDEKAAFARADLEDSAESYRRFLAAWPDSPDAALATRRIEELDAFRKAVSIDSEEGWRDFIARWPGGKRTSEAAQRLGSVLEKRAVNIRRVLATQTLAALDEVLAEHPAAAAYPEVAQHRLVLDDLDRARKGNPADCERFLARHTDSRFSDEIRTRLRKVNDERSWSEARAADTKAALEKYLDANPQGAHVTEARARQERLALDAVIAQDRVESFEAFLLGHRGSNLAVEARQRLNELQSFLTARNEGTEEGWKRHLATWPHGAHAARARAEILDFDATIIDPFGPGELEPEHPSAETIESPARKGHLTIRLAALAVIISILAGYGIYRRLSTAQPKDSGTPVRVAPAQTAPVPPTSTAIADAVPTLETLVIDVAPKAFVASVQDFSGKDWLGNKGGYTPVAITVPPGDYIVTFEHPSVETPIEKVVSVKAGSTNFARLQLFSPNSTEPVPSDGQVAPPPPSFALGAADETPVPQYDATRPVIAHGTVTRAGDYPGQSFRYLIVSTPSGDMEIAIGPTSFIRQASFKIQPGDPIDVVGVKVMWRGEERVVANRVTIRGRTLTLRDEKGTPMW